MSNFYTLAQQYGQNVLVKRYENGEQIVEKVKFSPTLFIKSNSKKSEWKSLYNDIPLDPIKFADIGEAKEFIERYKDVNGFEVHGMTKWNYQWINENYPGEIDYDLSKVPYLILDIETVGTEDDGFPDVELAKIPIVLISLYNSITKKTLVLGLKEYEKGEDDEFEYKKFNSESELLKYFIAYNQLHKFDIWTGWNTSQFDIPYLVNRIHNLMGEKMVKALSPFGVVQERRIKFMNKDIQTYEIYGIIDFDYLEAYKKFADMEKKESYALGYIAEYELGETKLELPGRSFIDNYENHFNTFVKYNGIDTLLVKKLDEKLKVIELAFALTYLYKCNLADVYKTVLPWEVYIFNFLADKKIAVPPRSVKENKPFEGGWVKEASPGMRGWTMTFDFASLYPHVMWQWNMSPETYVENSFFLQPTDFLFMTDKAKEAIAFAKEHNYTLAANGAMFKKDKIGIIAELSSMMINGRKIAKKEMLALESEYQKNKDPNLKIKIAILNNRQMAFKLSANSLYGGVANAGFHYNNWRMAEAITLSGQLSDQHLANKLTAKMNIILKTKDIDYIPAGDTDSVFLDCTKLVDTFCKDKTLDEKVNFLDKFGEQVCQPIINDSVQEIFDFSNGMKKVMNSKREAIASKFLFRGKKNYAMYVHNSEGVAYNPPKLKVQGIEIVRSSTPKWCRKHLKECLQMIFEKDELMLRKEFNKLKSEFLTLSVEEIAFPRGVSDMEKWYVDSAPFYILRTPVHVRASILFNQHCKNNKLLIKPIQNGDKIKFVYLKLPNNIHEDVIGFPTTEKLPIQLNLHKYVDYDKMFEKTFAHPLRTLTDVAGWQLEEVSSLEEFFS